MVFHPLRVNEAGGRLTQGGSLKGRFRRFGSLKYDPDKAVL
jgi:hypothetical protein